MPNITMGSCLSWCILGLQLVEDWTSAANSINGWLNWLQRRDTNTLLHWLLSDGQLGDSECWLCIAVDSSNSLDGSTRLGVSC